MAAATHSDKLTISRSRIYPYYARLHLLVWIYVLVILCQAGFSDGTETYFTPVRTKQEGSGVWGGANRTCPQRVWATIQIGGRPVRLALVRNPRVEPHQVPVILGVNGSFVQWKPQKSRQDFCTYQDYSMLASVNIRQDHPELKLEGTFHFEDRFYTIRPLSKSSQRMRRSASPRMLRQGHVLIDRGESFESTPRPMFHRHRRASVPSYGVEFLYVFDYALLQKFRDLFDDDNEEALENMRYYFAHVMNEIDTRYGSIISRDFTIYVRLAGFYISSSGADSPWTNDNKKSDGTVEVDEGLQDFRSWVNQHVSDLPTFDHAMAVTGFNLVAGSSDSITGQAYVGEICQYSRVAIIEDKGMFSSASVGAHELGHSIGAGHDGLGENFQCPASDQYIMTAIMDERTPDNFNNIFTFSSCSIQAFYRNILEMNNQDRNCLTNTAVTYDSSMFNTAMSEKPGQRYSLDDQCYFMLGEGSYFCGTQNDAGSICTKIFCYDTERSGCYQYTSGAMEGTTCGNNKWCIDTDCVYSSSAPEADDSCLFGDYAGLLNGNTVTCPQFIDSGPYYCYSEVNRNLCCATCAQYLDNSNPSCPYGDQASWCATAQQMQCNYSPNDETCCATCAQYHTGVSDCPYHDKYSWCQASSFTRIDCYSNADSCCGSCAAWATGPPGCEYGDKASGCQASHCDYDGNMDLCCETCNTYTYPPSTTTVTTPTTESSATTTSGTLASATCMLFFLHSCMNGFWHRM